MPLSRRAFLTLAAAVPFAGCGRRKPRVVLYCAQDREFAEPLLEGFSDDAGTQVVPRFDTESTKSVSLYNDLVAEKDRPRCDVFWNNEIVSTLRLHQRGLLEAHASPAGADYPDWARSRDHTWHAFAGRARVLLVNNRAVGERRPRSLLDLADDHWRGRVVMAKPEYGTTATQTACLFEVLGPDRARKYLTALRNNDVRIAPGNKHVAQWVSRGTTATGQSVAVGVTDTDDALGELREGKDVSIVFPDREGGEGRLGTLFIPNSLCIPKGCPNPTAARKLVDYLLSPEVEKALAEGPSGQAPLNPKVKAKLPASIETPATVRAMAVDWARAAELWDEAQTFVKKLFAT